MEKTKVLYDEAEKNGYLPNNINKYGETTLQIACRFQRVEIIEFLIKKCQKIFEEEKSLIAFEAPVKIFGDIHG